MARIVIPGCPHHVTQRGNHRQRVFYADSDRELYLRLLWEYFSQWRVEVHGYALMNNHVHLILVPETRASLAKGVGRLHQDFARWQQIQRDQTGHLWQNRFYSCPLDEDHLWKALRYIELNPVRARLVENAWQWPWSSAKAHVTGIDATGLLKMDLWRERFNGDRWRAFLEEGRREMLENDRLRLATRTGRPLGSEEFIHRLEVLTGRSLRPKRPGRKCSQSQVKRRPE